jgi:hypothetical protein
MTGAKLGEGSRGKALGEDVCELKRCWHMENLDFANSNLVPDEVYVDFDMFSTPVLHRVRRQVDNRHIIAVDDRGTRNRAVKFMQNLAKPARFSNMSHNPVFSFSTGARHGKLPFGGPGDEIITKKDTKPRGRATSIRASSPIGVRVCRERGIRGGRDVHVVR